MTERLFVTNATVIVPPCFVITISSLFLSDQKVKINRHMVKIILEKGGSLNAQSLLKAYMS